MSSFDSSTCFKKDGTLLKVYYREIEAIEAIRYVKNKYGKEQVSYRCNKCGFWHLSPKERQTKNSISECLDSNGKPKMAYETQEDAERRAKIIYDEKRIALRVYHCEECGKWHLTHT